MPTDEERREVAENLRVITAYGCRYAEQFYELLHEIVMDVEDFHDFRDVASRLADLIEPEPERTCEIEFDFPQGVGFKQIECRCSECWHGMSVHDHYCAECGAKVVE